MSNQGLLIVAATVAGALAGGLVAGWRVPVVAPTDAPAGTRSVQVDQLRIALEEERAARETLEEDMVVLQSVMDAMLALSSGPGSAGRSDDDDVAELLADAELPADPASAAGGEASGRSTGSAGRDGRRAGLSFDDSLLAAQGIPPADIERVRTRWEQNQLDRLYLTNEAMREGWIGTPQHRERMREINGSLREDLGESAFDQMLFATGRPNRIVVRDVLAESQASEVGILPGDQILRYDGTRIFGPRELSRSTATGESGAPVRVELLRDGRTVDMWLERGPIGIMLDHESKAPESNS